jgi:integrase
MPTAHISKHLVGSIRSGPRDVFIWDDELKGFGLRTTPNGSQSYVLQYRMGGREARSRRYTIGRHGSPWTPTTARKEAERLLIMVRQGVDPAQEAHERRRQAVDLAFDSYVETFIDLYLKKRWKKWSLGAGVLRREAVPVLGRKPLPSIRRSELSLITDRLHNRPAIARMTYATLRKLFRWAVSRGDLERSPLDGMEPPPAIPSRDRILSDDEVSAIWHGCEELGFPFGPLHRLLLLTGQRREEVASLDWRELSRRERLWTLPSTRAKNGRPHLVPLSKPTLEILDQLGGGRDWPNSGLILSTNGRTPPSGFSKAKRRLDQYVESVLGSGIQGDAWRIHDIRRTVATSLQRLGVRFEVTEAILNHVSGARSGIAGVYQRHDWASEKRAALDEWAAQLIRVVRA